MDEQIVLPESVETVIKACETMDGWAPPQKMRRMAKLILDSESRTRPLVLVEVGVFAGRSLLPQAAALRHLGAGRVYGVDPYTKEAAREGTHDPEHSWWWEQELGRFRDQFLGHLRWHQLEPWAALIEAPSEKAASLFDSGALDAVHIDGNHSPEVSTADVSTWWDRLRAGGHMWVDDTDWPSLSRAKDWLAAHGRLVNDFGSYQLWKKSAVA